MISRIAVTAFLFTSTHALAATVEKLSIVNNGEVIGSVVATIEGDRTDVAFRVDDNGRGPKHREEIVMGAAALPTSWAIKGTSLMGGPVNEQFSWEGGKANWSSQADIGSVAAAKPGLYIVNDDSPWVFGVYARAALATKDHRLNVLPGGQLSLVKLEDRNVGTGRAAVSVALYRIDGVGMQPNYVLLERNGRLFATLAGGNVTVRSGYEKEVPGLLELGLRAETDRIKAITARIAHRYDGPVRIRNVHVFDPVAGRSGPLSTIVVMRDKVTGILPGDGGPVPAGETAIEGAGGTVYPGLHDMHTHTSLTSGLFFLAAGVTTTRDMGNDNGFFRKFLPLADSGVIASPRIIPDGFIEGRSPFSAHYGKIIGTLDEGLEAVRWYADRGYFQIKIYSSMNPEYVKPLAAEAKRLGMGVTGHIPAFYSPDRASVEGYDTIAHINQLMLLWLLDPKEDTRSALRLTALARAANLDLGSARVKHSIDLMKDHGVSLDTTAVVVERLMLSRARTVQASDTDIMSHMPIGYQRIRQRTNVPLKDETEDRSYFTAFDKVVDTLALLHRNGIQLLPGTDDTTGFTLHRELELYVRAGYTPAEALKAATLDCETYFHASEAFGTIERGKVADLVLVPGDPVTDIKAVKKPRLVMRGGTVYLPSEIYAELGIKPFVDAPSIVPATPESAPASAANAGALFGGEAGWDHMH